MIYNELVARFLHTFKPICYNCRKFGHYATACPSASSPLTTLNHQSQPPFLAPSEQIQGRQPHTTSQLASCSHYQSTVSHIYPQRIASCSSPQQIANNSPVTTSTNSEDAKSSGVHTLFLLIFAPL